MTPPLEARQLKLGHRLKDVSLSFQTGSSTAILGPNGAGKSTLMSALAGLLPVKGDIRWSGRELKTIPYLERGRMLSFLGQESHADFAFSVRDVVSQGRYAWGDESHTSVDSAMAQLDISHLADRSVLELSGGERRRVFLARCLATEAPIHLWDEPASNLDVRHSLEVYALAKRLAALGSMVVVTLHDIRAATRFDRVIVVNEGSLVAEGKPTDVMTPDLIRNVFRVEARFVTTLVPELPEE